VNGFVSGLSNETVMIDAVGSADGGILNRSTSDALPNDPVWVTDEA
jgi:hypothetical protein